MKQRRTETRTIAGLEVTTVQLPAMRGSRLRFRVLRTIMPALATLNEFRGKSMDEIMASDVGKLLPALRHVVEQLDDKAQESFLLEVLLCTNVISIDESGKRIVVELTSASFVDLAFGGDVDALWQTFAFALEVNLGGFFDVVRDALKARPRAASA